MIENHPIIEISENALVSKYGLLMTTEQLADLFDLTPEGVRYALLNTNGSLAKLSQHKKRIGRRVYIPASAVCAVLNDENSHTDDGLTSR